MDDSNRPPIAGFEWPTSSRVVFVDCCWGEGEETLSGTSHENLMEAQALVKVLIHLVQEGPASRLRSEDIAVITGYSAQRRLLRKLIGDLCPEHVENLRIDTIDGFQGMERALVLVSAVRANSFGEIGFLRDPRRANVLLTRAQNGMIVFGDRATLACEKTVWAPWLAWVDSMGAMVPQLSLPPLLI